MPMFNSKTNFFHVLQFNQYANCKRNRTFVKLYRYLYFNLLFQLKQPISLFSYVKHTPVKHTDILSATKMIISNLWESWTKCRKTYDIVFSVVEAQLLWHALLFPLLIIQHIASFAYPYYLYSLIRDRVDKKMLALRSFIPHFKWILCKEHKL